MKKTLLALVLIFSAAAVSAQGNLQFNKALLYEISVTQVGSTYTQTDVVVTVPANKVWKLDATGCSTFTTGTNAIGTGGYMLLNTKVISGYASNTYSYTPIWLAAGTYTFSCKSNNLSAGNIYNGFISGIEFNIVP